MTYVTTVRIPDELAEAVKTYCALTGASVNGALCVALERLVAVVDQTRSSEVRESLISAGRELLALREDALTGRGAGSGAPLKEDVAGLTAAGSVPRPVSASNQVEPDWRGGKP